MHILSIYMYMYCSNMAKRSAEHRFNLIILSPSAHWKFITVVLLTTAGKNIGLSWMNSNWTQVIWMSFKSICLFKKQLKWLHALKKFLLPQSLFLQLKLSDIEINRKGFKLNATKQITLNFATRLSHFTERNTNVHVHNYNVYTCTYTYRVFQIDFSDWFFQDCKIPINPFTSKISLLILLIVSHIFHTFYLSLTDF